MRVLSSSSYFPANIILYDSGLMPFLLSISSLSSKTESFLLTFKVKVVPVIVLMNIWISFDGVYSDIFKEVLVKFALTS